MPRAGDFVESMVEFQRILTDKILRGVYSEQAKIFRCCGSYVGKICKGMGFRTIGFRWIHGSIPVLLSILHVILD